MNVIDQKSNKKNFVFKNVRLYLRVHVMPELNKPLRGKAWQWISPFIVLAVLIFAFFYFLTD